MTGRRQSTAYAVSPRKIVRVGVRPAELEAYAGRTVTLQIGLENRSNNEQTIQLVAGGVPEEWVLFSDEIVTLAPRERFVSEMQLWPSGTLAGERTLAIMAHLAYAPDEAATLNVSLNFPIVDKFDVELNPTTLKHGKQFSIQIHNRGNADSTFALTFMPDDELEGEMVGGDAEFHVPASTHGRRRFKVKAFDRHLIGNVREIPFILTITSANGQRKKKYGTLDVTPWIPTWLPLALGVVVIGLFVFLLIRASAPPPPILPPELAGVPPRAEECDVSRIVAVYPSVIVSTPRIEAAQPTPAGVVVGTPSIIENDDPPAQAMQTAYQFLDLPFPYAGSAEQFWQANDYSSNGGRINQFFDHLHPLYPAPTAGNITRGEENAEAPIGGHILLYTGSLQPTSYSGHPGIDYAPDYNQADTPVLAAADGVIIVAEEREELNNLIWVWLQHEVPGAGSFATLYLHLQDDTHFQQLSKGQVVAQGDRIGTMGNTGFSTGVHLHFEVRFDANGNGFFDPYEKVDPFGYVPSDTYPTDPWNEAFSFVNRRGNTVPHQGIISRYLWIHSMSGFSGAIPSNGGGVFPSGGTGGAGDVPLGCAPSSALPRNGTINWLWSPDPPPTAERAGIGQGCSLSVFDGDGDPVTRFEKPIRIELPYSDSDLLRENRAGQSIQYVEEDMLKVWWKASGANQRYEPLNTTLTQDDTGQKFAVAYTEIPGHCALMGTPAINFLPPDVEIRVNGNLYDQFRFTDTVTVTLEADGSYDAIEYSLNAGDDWIPYTQPFTLTVGASPDYRVTTENDEFAEGLPQNREGLNLVLAVAISEAGNRTEPPASRLIIIDPNPSTDPYDPDYCDYCDHK